MKKINKKQKIILICISIIIILGISYYVYSKENNTENISKLEIENTSQEEEIEKETEEKKIKVHVSGAVVNEGVIELEEGARINEAIEKAGGFSSNAYTKDINLASILEDGTKIYVQTNEEANNQETENIQTNTSSKTTTSSNSSNSNKKVNINTANEEQLITLPGIGEATAKKITTYRKEKGKFKKKEDIKNVSGIGESKFEKIKDLIEI